MSTLKIITAKDIWDFVHALIQDKGPMAEILEGKCHVLNISEEQPYKWKFNDIRYRVYHSDGYCFDIERRYVDGYEDIDCGMLYKSENSFDYEVFPEVWDGFKNKTPLTINACMKILKETFPNKVNS